MLNKIISVDEGSPLRGRVEAGDELLFVNRHSIRDVLDYKYWTYERHLTLEFKNAGKLRIRKDVGEDLGLNFETYLMDRPTGCANHCVFCFIDQLPKGMRPTLYFKDDDARLSFLTGNYITCSNLSERELQRICELRVSPLNISVHATDGALRAKMIGNPRGCEIMEILRRFAAAGIMMDCQIVACPGWNDGAALEQSMRDLAGLYPNVNSVSVVPVGLTKHREGLTALTPYDEETASATVRQVERFAEECLRTHESRIFFCSDELYLKAKLPLPEDTYYEGYPQLENGVGLLRLLQTEFDDALCDAPGGDCPALSVATGMAAEPFIRSLAEKVNPNATVFGIPNDFFGHTVDVAGLVTGGDIIRHCKGRPLGARLLIPATMLRHGEGVFLDDLTPEDVGRELGVPVTPVPCDGAKLLQALRGSL